MARNKERADRAPRGKAGDYISRWAFASSVCVTLFLFSARLAFFSFLALYLLSSLTIVCLLYSFWVSSSVSNAKLIEIHSDKINNEALKNVRVLASAFWNGNEVVPAEIEIKEYKQGRSVEPKLYMAVTINKEGKTVHGSSTEMAALPVNPPSGIRLTDLVKGVNDRNNDFLKYFPDKYLSLILPTISTGTAFFVASDTFMLTFCKIGSLNPSPYSDVPYPNSLMLSALQH